jgi:hypothetical protein
VDGEQVFSVAGCVFHGGLDRAFYRGLHTVTEKNRFEIHFKLNI